LEVNLKNIRESFFNDLKEIYDEREIKSLFEMVCESVFGLTRTDLLLKDVALLLEGDMLKFDFVLSELIKRLPIQYVFGEAHFYERLFNVNEHVLIPRQETEELIQLILKSTSDTSSKILDIGTGSGIIPITLNKELAESDVWAIDISKEALKVAEVNSKKHDSNITFKEIDVLDESKWNDLPNDFNVIVSNPPYVLNSEKELMHNNVLDYEPHLALFVEDNNPLLFYKKITKLAIQKLKKGGKLYFEINEMYGKETANLLTESFKEVKVEKDINGKDRFVYGIKE
jgi:release factor glutamine methyltransferase